VDTQKQFLTLHPQTTTHDEHYDPPSIYLFEENSVARDSRRFAVPVPERRVASVHVALETDCTRATRERRRAVRRHRRRRSLPVRCRSPPDRLAVANRPPVVVVVLVVVITVVAATAAAAKSVTNAVAVVIVTADVHIVVVVATTTIVTSTQSCADKREQLLYVSVKLVGQTSDTGRAGHRRVGRRNVSQHVRFEVYRLGVSRLRRTVLWRLVPVLLQAFVLLLVCTVLLQVFTLLMVFTLMLVLMVPNVFALLLLRRGIHVGRRGGDVQRRFRPVCLDHFHRRTGRLSLFRDRRNAAVVVHAARQYHRRSAFGTRRPPSPGAPQTITPQRRLLIVHRHHDRFWLVSRSLAVL